MKRTRLNRFAVIGGGPAGLAAVILLRRAGYECCLIEKGDWNGFRPGEHLGPEALEHLSRLDPEVNSAGYPGIPCTGIDVAWGEDRIHANDALFNPYGEGRILARPAFDVRLAAVATAEGVRLMPCTVLTDIRRAEEGFRLKLKTLMGTLTIAADFILDATGRPARAARLLGARLMRYDRLIGLGRIFEAPAVAERARGLIEAAPNGWFFSVPLPQGGVAAYYMTDPGPSLPADGVGFAYALAGAPHTAARLFGLEGGELQARPAHSQTLSRLYGDGWLALGDAAMSFDPLSSAGISKGLKSAFQAVEALQAHIAGDAQALPQYAAQARQEFGEYLKARQYFYAKEARWPQSAFWRRRKLLPGAGELNMAPGDPVHAEAVPETWHWRFGHLGAERLLERAAAGGTAAEVLQAHKKWLRSGDFDTELVAALSALRA